MTSRGAILAGAALAATAAALGLAACGASSADTSGFGGSAYDGGSSSGGGDSGGADSSTLADGGGARVPSALFVQASPSVDLGAVRLCWQTTTGGMTTRKPFPNQIMPASNYAGLPIGGASLLANASELVGAGDVTLYAIDARQLAQLEEIGNQKFSCDELICSGGGSGGGSCLTENKQYWTLGSIPAASFTPGATNVVAIEGCLYSALDPDATTARCGADWTSSTGNLHAEVLPLVDSPIVPGELFVQSAQLSPALASLLGDAGSAAVSLGTASAPQSPVATLSTTGQVAPQQPEALPLDASLPDYGQLGIRVDVQGVDAGAANLFMSLAQAQQLVDPSVDPSTFYSSGGTYLVAVVGDPNAPHAFSASGDGGTYDGTGLHVLVVPAQLAP